MRCERDDDDEKRYTDTQRHRDTHMMCCVICVSSVVVDLSVLCLLLLIWDFESLKH